MVDCKRLRFAAAMTLLVFGQTSADSASAQLSPTSESQPVTLQKFISGMLTEARPYILDKQIGVFLGFPEDAPGRTRSLSSQATTDGMGHQCVLMTDGLTGHPLALVLVNQIRSGLDSESHYFRLAVDGSLELAFVSWGKYDEAGKPVMGTGQAKMVETNSPEARGILRHELDFWLKGMYRKQTPIQP